MSQVDYLHFFNNIFWNLIQFVIMYSIISVIYVQSFYKVLRLRLLNFKILNITLKEQDFFINKFINKFKEFFKMLFNIVKFYKLKKNGNKKIRKCFYE